MWSVEESGFHNYDLNMNYELMIEKKLKDKHSLYQQWALQEQH